MNILPGVRQLDQRSTTTHCVTIHQVTMLTLHDAQCHDNESSRISRIYIYICMHASNLAALYGLPKLNPESASKKNAGPLQFLHGEQPVCNGGSGSGLLLVL